MRNDGGRLPPQCQTIPDVFGTRATPAPPSHKVFRVLYVPDPSRELDEHPCGDLGWISRNITLGQYEGIKHLRRACYAEVPQPNDTPEGGIRVEIMEWLWTMICMSEHEQQGVKSFDMHYMNWTDFRTTVCSPSQSPEGWTLLASMDCIIGGLDYTIGISLADRTNYGLDQNDMHNFECNMDRLGNDVAIWPPTAQVQLAGHKQRTMAFLDGIAAAHGWKRPYTRVIRDGEPIPIDGVLKRSHSDCGSHVLLPEASVSEEVADAARRKRALAACRTWASIQNRTTSVQQSWMCQEYIPTLLNLGEWRFFLVGERIINVVHTVKCVESDRWMGQPATSFYTTREIREIWARFNRGEIKITDDLFVNPPQEDDSGTAEVHDFVRTVVRELVVRESKAHGMYNSMSVFCRVDIGLMFDGAGEPSYFVNEIERTATASLWLRTLKEDDQRAIADTFSGVFHTYLSHPEYLDF